MIREKTRKRLQRVAGMGTLDSSGSVTITTEEARYLLRVAGEADAGAITLTARQLELVELVAGSWEADGCAPTYAQLGERMSLSKPTVHELASRAIERGALERGPRCSVNTLRLTPAMRRQLLAAEVRA